MWLARAATIELSDPPPPAVGRRPFLATNGCTVQVTSIKGAEGFDKPPTDQTRVTWSFAGEAAVIGVSVTVGTGSPEIIDGRVRVPVEPRLQAEEAIDEFADLLAVTYQCRRIVRSPMAGCVAVAPATDQERTALQGVTEMHADPHGNHPLARLLPTMAPGDLQELLADRPDGGALLADALSEPNPVARAREFFRLFERAFGKASERLINPLSEFLMGHPRHDALGYTGEEVKHWLQTLRPETVHGDKRPHVARAGDVQPYLGRLEVAMYDVVLNKTYWRRGDTQRRPGAPLLSAVTPDRTGAVLLDPRASSRITWTDRFGRCPTDWNARLAVGPEWIWAGPGQRDDFDRDKVAKAGWDLH